MKIIFIQEEVIKIPMIAPTIGKNYILPQKVDNKSYNFKILNHSKDDLEKFASIDNDIKINEKDLNSSKKIIVKKNTIAPLKKFVVQLGVFKNKKNAMSQLVKLKSKFDNLLYNVKINIVDIKNKNVTFYKVETNSISKKNAINLCNSFKDKKINCIIKIKK